MMSSTEHRHRHQLFIAYSAITVWIMALFVGVSYITWLVAENYFDGPSTVVFGAKIKDHDGIVFTPGDKITIAFMTRRLRTCTLQVGRYVRRTDGPTGQSVDRLVDSVTQTFDSAPNLVFPSQYTATIPDDLQAGKYIIFSYSRYYCNLLDHILPRYYYAAEVPFILVRNPNAPEPPTPKVISPRNFK